MDLLDSQDLKNGQTRRVALLLRLLERCDQPEQALELAMRMEQFVLDGTSQDNSARVNCDAQATSEVVPIRPNAKMAAVGAKSLAEETTKSSSEAPRIGKYAVASRKRRWTAEEDETLERLAGQDMSLDQIASELDRTEIGIRERARAKDIKIKPRKRGRRPGSSNPKPVGEPTATSLANGKSTKVNGKPRSFGGSRFKSRKKLPPVDQEKDAALVEEFLRQHGVTRPLMTIDTVVKFMRTRDYSVVLGDDSRYVVDGREHMTAAELLDRANTLRKCLGQPPFPGQLATNGVPNGSNGASFIQPRPIGIAPPALAG